MGSFVIQTIDGVQYPIFTFRESIMPCNTAIVVFAFPLYDVNKNKIRTVIAPVIKDDNYVKCVTDESVRGSFTSKMRSSCKSTDELPLSAFAGTVYQDVWKISPINNKHIDRGKELSFSVNLIRTTITVHVTPVDALSQRSQLASPEGLLREEVCLKIAPIYDSSNGIITKSFSVTDDKQVMLQLSILLGVYIFAFKSGDTHSIQTAFTNSDVVFVVK